MLARTGLIPVSSTTIPFIFIDMKKSELKQIIREIINENIDQSIENYKRDLVNAEREYLWRRKYYSNHTDNFGYVKAAADQVNNLRQQLNRLQKVKSGEQQYQQRAAKQKSDMERVSNRPVWSRSKPTTPTKPPTPSYIPTSEPEDEPMSGGISPHAGVENDPSWNSAWDAKERAEREIRRKKRQARKEREYWKHHPPPKIDEPTSSDKWEKNPPNSIFE